MPYKDKEIARQKQREYYQKNKERIKKYQIQYHSLHKDKLNAECREYHELHKEKYNEQNREYWNEHKEELNRRRREYRANNHEGMKKKDGIRYQRYKTQTKKRKDSLKKQVVDAYGGMCECCKEAKLGFLTIDHIDGNGRKHRESLGISGSGYNFYGWIIKNDFPKNLRILCYNCNCGRSHNGGICPHKQKDII